MAKFKVGDRVRCIESPTSGDEYLGVVATVTKLSPGGEIQETDYGPWAGFGYVDDWFELEEQPRNILTEYPGIWNYRPGEVIQIGSDWCTGWSQQEIMSRAIEYKNKSFMSSIKEQFVLAFKSEPEKSFRIKGITNGDDMLTSDGQQIFLSWLLKKNGEAFKAEVVDTIKVENN